MSPDDRPRAAISWSGGKDSCAALKRTHDSFDIAAMVTMFDESGTRSRSHGLRPSVIAAQARRLGLRQLAGFCTWDTYDDVFADALASARKTGITHVVFGDILFEEHRRWAETMCQRADLIAVEPLWGLPTKDLFDEWTSSGDEAVIVTTREATLDETWLGRTLVSEMHADFTRLGVDPCGERGEYHTVVTRTSLFSSPLRLRRQEAVRRSGCWALDVEVEDDAQGN